MKKVGIVTIVDDNNYGNRLQNYAVQYKLNSLNCCTETLRNVKTLNTKDKFCIRVIKHLLCKKKKVESKRRECFEKFNELIKFSTKLITPFSKINTKYDYFVVGSDQVWNPDLGRLRAVDLLNFAEDRQKIAFSASFGINELNVKNKKEMIKAFDSFKKISVREDAGKKIIEGLTDKKNVEVLVDPTMLLTAEEWSKVAVKPEQLKNEKYILNYFLGELSAERKKEIEKIAKKNKCKIINVLDEKSPFYQIGPSEFVYLEKNAFLICTDSFHSSVFAILFNKPFVIFDREQKGIKSMNSRLDTLINKFKLKNRKYNGTNITEENLNHDYSEAYKILEEERKKSDEFLRKALDIKDSE